MPPTIQQQTHWAPHHSTDVQPITTLNVHTYNLHCTVLCTVLPYAIGVDEFKS